MGCICIHEIAIMQAEKLQLLSEQVFKVFLFFYCAPGAACKAIPNQQQNKVIALYQFFQDVFGFYFNNHVVSGGFNIVTFYGKVETLPVKWIE
jgi:hypothetical protein